MNRETAIKVLHEILEKYGGSLVIRSISLSIPDQKSFDDIEHYELHLACLIDDQLKQQLNMTVIENRLRMREMPDGIIIY